MNTQTMTIVLLAVIVALLVGIFIGKGIGYRRMGMNDMHRMDDGRMMMNHGDMDSMMDDMNAALEGKTGDAFDEAFLNEMVVHHEGAIVMAQKVLTTSKRPELIKLANEIIAAQTREVSMMNEWKKTWFNK